ncbi:MAG: phasin family protein [Rubricoccaceae bacterium]
MATKTKQLQTEIKKTTDDAVALARTTAENVQKEVSETAGDVREAAQKVFLAGLGALSLAEEEGSKFFKKLVKKGEKVDVNILGADRLKKVRSQVTSKADEAEEAVKGRVADAKYAANEAAGKFEERVQEAVAAVMKRIGVPTREEISELTASVERLTKHIEKLKKEQKAAAAAPAATPLAVSVGGGWYEIKVGDVVVEKVQGKEEAEAAVARLAAQQA